MQSVITDVPKDRHCPPILCLGPLVILTYPHCAYILYKVGFVQSQVDHTVRHFVIQPHATVRN